MNTNTVIAGALVASLFGFFACFSGYRIFKLVAATIGFAAGAMLGVALASSLAVTPGQETIIIIILAVVVGFVGAALAWLLYIVVIFLAGAVIGASVGASIAVALQTGITLHLILILVLALMVGILAIAAQKLFIILVTAFGGAELIVAGVSPLLTGSAANLIFNPLALLQPRAVQALPGGSVLILVGELALGITGVLVQYWVTARAAKPVVGPTAKVT